MESLFQSRLLRIAKIGKLLRVMKLMKMMRLGKLKRLVQKARAKFDISNTVLAMIKYGLMIAVFAHWGSCVLWLVPRFRGFPESSWVNVYLAGTNQGPAINLTVGSRYLIGFYFSMTIMSTLGFGEITPQNDVERIMLILLMLVGAMIFAYAITNVCAMVITMDVNKSKFTQLQDCVKDLCTMLHITDVLSKQVKRFLLYKYYTSDIEMFGGFELVKNFSVGLQDAFWDEFVKANLPEAYDFLHRFGVNFATEIAQCLQGNCFAPRDPLTVQFTKATYIYFLFKGEVELILDLKIGKQCTSCSFKSKPGKKSTKKKKITPADSEKSTKSPRKLTENNITKESKDSSNPLKEQNGYVRDGDNTDNCHNGIQYDRIILKQGASFNYVPFFIGDDVNLVSLANKFTNKSTTFSVRYSEVYTIKGSLFAKAMRNQNHNEYVKFVNILKKKRRT